MTLRIGPLRVDPPVVLAPMAGVTNAPFRQLCRSFGGGLYVSEMIGARALVEGNAKSERLAAFAPGESPRSLQLYGTDPAVLAEAARRLVGEDRVDHLDLNFGCPVPKVTRHGGGAALPVRRRLLASILDHTVRAAGAVPVTAKFRMGVDDDHLTFLDAGRIAEHAGCAAVSLHARTAEQAYSGPARWPAIAELKAAVTTIPVLGNGDIWEAADAVAMMRDTGCDGVVVGRGCLGRPWLFRDLDAALAGRPAPPPPTLGEVAAVMVRHLDLLLAWNGERGVREFRRHTGWYLTGYPCGSAVRAELSQLRSRNHLVAVLTSLDPSARPAREAARAKRGHRHGPQRVALPDGWLERPDTDEPLPALADAFTSGG